MSYAKNLLSRGEEVVFETRQHWFAVLAETWGYVLTAIITFALLLFVSTNSQPVGNDTIDGILTLIFAIVLLASLAMIGIKIWSWRNQEYLITTRRVIKSQGIFNKEMGDSSLEKVNDARLSQSWIGRIFDYGTLDILTASEAAEIGLLNDFQMIAEPVTFKVAMLNQKERLERPDLAPAPRFGSQPAPPPMQRAEPMPPRAGSDRVSEVHPEPAAAPAAPFEPATSATPATPAAADDLPAPSAPSDVSRSATGLAGTLESLASLRDKGLITPEEYEAKKRELLERM